MYDEEDVGMGGVIGCISGPYRLRREGSGGTQVGGIPLPHGGL